MIRDHIDAVFQKKFACPGQQLDCIIYLAVSKYHQRARLTCKISGKEKTALTIYRTEHYTDSDGNGATRQIPEYITDKKTIYKYEHVFLEGPISPGFYQFPYSFTLPNNIPSSFKEVRGPNDYAKIKYETKVVMQSQDGSKMQDEDDVFVIQVYPSDFAQEERKQKFQINCYCCYDRGSIVLRGAFDKTIYHPGEQAPFNFWADTEESEVSIKDIRAQCMRYVTVKCKGHSNVWSTTVDTVNYDKVKKGKSIGPLLMTPTIKAKENEMSTIGNLIKSEYSLVALAYMDKCCQVDPSIALPILVCHYPQYDMNAYIKPYQPPPDYNPQIYPPVIYNLNGTTGNCVNNSAQYPNYYNQGGNMNQPPILPAPMGGMGMAQGGYMNQPVLQPTPMGGMNQGVQMNQQPLPPVPMNGMGMNQGGQINQQPLPPRPVNGTGMTNPGPMNTGMELIPLNQQKAQPGQPLNPMVHLNVVNQNVQQNQGGIPQQNAGAHYQKNDFSDDSSDEEMGKL